MIPDLAVIRSEVEAMAGEVRDSAGEGERASARRLADRLREAGAPEVSVDPYSYQGTYAIAHALHAAAGLAAARLGGARGALLGLGALASLELEASGRLQWIRRVLPAGEGANVVARLPAARASSGIRRSPRPAPPAGCARGASRASCARRPRASR